MKKRIVSCLTATMLLLGLWNIVSISAEEAPIEVAKDYVAGEIPENLITTYPTEGNLNINAGEVRAQAAGTIATLSAVADCDGHGSLGLQGFNIDSLFISSIPGTGYMPAFSKGDNVLFSGKVRKSSGATADTKLNIVYASEGYGKQYYPDNYPSATNGISLTDTEWKEFKTVMKAPENFGGQYWYFLIGFSNGIKTGAKAEIDMSSLYFGTEVAHDMKMTVDGKTDVEAGAESTIRADVDILNQLDDLYSEQGAFRWYALDATRTQIVSDIVIIPEEDGKAIVQIGADVPAGDYVIAAQSETHPEMVKSFTVNVGTKDWSDHEAIVVDSWYNNPEMSNNWSANIDGSPAFTIGEGEVGTTITGTDLIANHGDMKDRLMGVYFPQMIGSASGTVQKEYPAGTQFMISFQVRNVTPDKTAKVNAAMYSWGELFSITPDAYPSVAYEDCFTIEGADWNTFSGVFTLPKELSLEWYSLDIGYPSGTEPGTTIEIDGDSFYLAPYRACDIRITPNEGVAELDPGVKSEFSAQILDNAGIPMAGAQSFRWALIREDKSARVSGVTFETEGANVSVVVDKTVAPGNYYLAAESASEETAGWMKSVPVKVLKPTIHDYAAGSIPGDIYDILLTRTDAGAQIMGLTDTAAFSVSAVDKNGAEILEEQEFVWFVMDETRKEDVSDSFEITVKEETNKASVTPKLTTANGTYYVMAQYAEHSDMVKAVRIDVDKAQSVASGAELLNQGEAEEIEEKLLDIALIAEVSDEIFKVMQEETGAVKKETANILAASFGGKDVLPTEDTDALGEAIEKAVVIALYNENPDAVTLWDKAGKFIYADELGLSAIDTDGVTLYDVFLNVLSDEGRIAVQKAMQEEKGTTIRDFMDDFTECIVLYGVKYPEQLGVSYLEKILTKENLKAADIEAPKYLARKDKSETHKEIARTLYTKETLIKALEAESEEEESGSGSSGGGASGGGAGGGRGSGGGYSASVTTPVEKETDKEQKAEFPKFSDVSESHWAYKDIYYLRERGIINGMDEKTFCPDGYITREQFAKILCAALELQVTKTETAFKDVDPNAWYAPYVSTVYQNGIVTGIDEDTFGVGNYITRQDLCTMLYRTAEHQNVSYTVLGFTDEEEIASYAKDGVALLKEHQIVNGYEDGSFKPNGLCTRAEAAKMICKFLAVQEVL